MIIIAVVGTVVVGVEVEIAIAGFVAKKFVVGFEMASYSD
jgi:hypothetical protein